MNEHLETTSDMRVLITGAGGYVGSLLTPLLLQNGYQVIAFDAFYFGKHTLDRAIHMPHLQVVQGDVRTLDPNLLKGIEAVIDLAALSNDPACELEPTLTVSINRDASLRLARLSKDAGVKRFLFASSCSVYGATGGDTLTEEAHPSPLSLYAEMKLEVERGLKELADHTFHPVSLRKGTLFGLSPRMRFDLAINVMTLNAVTKKRLYITGGGEQWRPFLHVMDAARAYLCCLQTPSAVFSGQVFNVIDQNIQLGNLGSLIGQRVGSDVTYVQGARDLRSYHISGQRFASQLHFRPQYSIENGVD